jgi:DNA-binding MarR family transcriptional regulator
LGRAWSPRTGHGYELPLLLFAGFRSIIDELNAELARHGHQDMRPAHVFAMQAIGFSGATATEVGRRLGISKQAAGKTVERREALGYVERAGDGADRRRKLVRLTPRGIEALTIRRELTRPTRHAPSHPARKSDQPPEPPAATHHSHRDRAGLH